MTRLTFEAVAELLKQRLYQETEEPGDGDEGKGRVITLSYDQLSSLSGHKRFTELFYNQVRWQGWYIGLNIGFGSHGVVVATDDHFAPDAIGNWP